MSEKYTDEEVERYVRFPNTLDDTRRRSIEEALERDPKLGRLAEYYRAFWAAYDVAVPSLPPRAQAFLSRLFPGDGYCI
jgi:hypothetical protein